MKQPLLHLAKGMPMLINYKLQIMKKDNLKLEELKNQELLALNGGTLTTNIWYGIGLLIGALAEAGASPAERANYY